MTNPWEEINLDDYEKHMSLDSVRQLQTMNSIMKDQFEDYPVDTATVFGIAGGNGLEHVSTEKYSKVYGIITMSLAIEGTRVAVTDARWIPSKEE